MNTRTSDGKTFSQRVVPRSCSKECNWGFAVWFMEVCACSKNNNISISLCFAQGKRMQGLHWKLGHIGMWQSHHRIIPMHQTRGAMIELVPAPQANVHIYIYYLYLCINTNNIPEKSHFSSSWGNMTCTSFRTSQTMHENTRLYRCDEPVPFTCETPRSSTRAVRLTLFWQLRPQ